MRWHKVQETLQRSIETVELELSVLEEGRRNAFNEDRAAVADELEMLRGLAKTLDEWQLDRCRQAVLRMEERQKNQEC